MSGHIAPLTGVRAFAALWVVAFHFRPYVLTAVPASWPLMPLFNVGYLGVDLFFVLSGFVLTYVHAQEFGTRRPRLGVALRFLWLRLGRVWPAMAAVVILYGAYNVAKMWIFDEPGYQDALDPGRLLSHLTLTQAWTTHHHDWNPVDWSVSSEWFAYLTFVPLMPLVARLALVLSRRQAVVLALVLVLPVVIVGLGMQDGTDLLWRDGEMVGGIAFLRVFCEFWAGSLIFLAIRHRGGVRRASWAPTVIAVAVLTVIYGLARFDPFVNPRFGAEWSKDGHDLWGTTESVVVVPLFILLVATLATCEDPLTRLLSWRPVVFLGTISFSIYLVHWMFLDAFVLLVDEWELTDGPRYGALLAAAIGTAIVAGWALWRWVEEPSRKAARRVLTAGSADAA